MPITEAKSPPPKRNTGGGAKAAPVSNFGKVSGYEQSIKALAGTGIMLTSFAKQPADSMALANYFGDDATVRKLAENATRNAYFGKLLDALDGAGGPILELAILVLPLGMQILCNHGLIPANPAMGVMPKEILMAQAQQAALEAQAAADAAMREAMDAINLSQYDKQPA